MDQGQQVVVGLDNGGTTNNATVLDSTGKFLVDGLVETPSRVREGPAIAVEALAESFAHILQITGLSMMLYRWPLVGLPTYRVGVVLTVIAAAATLVSMLVYLRAAWPELKR